MKSISIVLSAALALLIGISSSRAALIGHWAFEEGSGTSTANTGTGSGPAGTLGTGTSWSTDVPTSVAGGSNRSIRFDGTDFAHVVMTGYKVPEVLGTTSRTLAAWIKSAPGINIGDVTAGNLGIFGYGTNAAGQKWNFRVQNQNGTIDGNIRVEVNGGYIIGSTLVVDNTWHHVAMTWTNDGTPDVVDAKLYVDGVEETINASLTELINTTSGIDLNIGDDHSGREWNGWLDDIRIYDEALSPAAIANLAAGIPEPSTSLLGLLGTGLLVLRRRRK